MRLRYVVRVRYDREHGVHEQSWPHCHYVKIHENQEQLVVDNGDEEIVIPFDEMDEFKVKPRYINQEPEDDE